MAIGEFARSENQKAQLSTLELRHRFLLKVEDQAPEVLKSLHDDVFVGQQRLFPLDFDKLEDLFDRRVLDAWDKKNSGKLLQELNNARSAGDEGLAKSLALSREIAADADWARAHETHETHALWQGLEACDHYCPELLPLRDAVTEWSVKSRLNADWCRNAALQTLNYWARFGCDYEWGHSVAYGGGRADIDPESESRLLPWPTLPRWLPFQEKESQYLTRIERSLRKHLLNHPVWSGCAQSPLKSHLDSVIKQVVGYIEDMYCKELATFYASKQHRPFQASLKPDQHMEWTIRVWVLGENFTKVAHSANKTRTAVRKAVVQILQVIEPSWVTTLKTRFPAGRPKET